MSSSAYIPLDEYVKLDDGLARVYRCSITEGKYYKGRRGYYMLVKDKVLGKKEALELYPEEFI